MPKVSILVPVYNVERYLRECLDSIINQTLQDIEIVCINDGSTDNSLLILEEYRNRDGRIKIIDKNNSGYGDSMNMGLDIAQGDYIGIVESDDFAKDTMFEDLYNLAKKHDADMVKSDFWEYTSFNKVSRKTGMFDKERLHTVVNIAQYPHLVRRPPSIWSAIYKRSFLQDCKIRFLKTPGASFQDTSFSFKTLTQAKKLVLTNQAYLYYRCDNVFSSVYSKDKVYAVCKEFEEITQFLNTNLEIKKLVNTQKLVKQYKTYLWNVKRISDEAKHDFIVEFSKVFKYYQEIGEIDSDFFLKVDKKEFELLISDESSFLCYVIDLIKKEEKKMQRRKKFSIRINKSRVSIILFGKQIVEIG